MKKILFALLIISILGLTACAQNIPVNHTNNVSISQDVKKFNNIDEMKTFLAEQQTSNSGYDTRGGVMFKNAGMETLSAVSSDSAAPSASGSADYSTTNVQVQGVDEADFIKNDDKYIYMAQENNLIIIAADGKNSMIVSETKIQAEDNYYGTPTIRDLFLNKNKIILFIDSYDKSFYFEKYNIQPLETTKQNSKVLVYNIENREKPVLEETFTISGGYFSSRMINNIVYVITQEGLYNWMYYDGPMIKYAATTIRPSIYYFDNPEQNYNMNTITSINVDSNAVVDSEAFMLGYTDTLMVSENNIYIAYQNQQYRCWGWRCPSYDTSNRERFMTVVVPLLEGDIKNKVTDITSKNLDSEEEWTQISKEFSAFYTDLQENKDVQDKYEKMFGKIEDALNEYDSKKALENTKTTIHKIAINNGQIDYVTKGEVAGRLLNQYSLDEFDGNLRLATTIDAWTTKTRIQYNNVYVLNDKLETIGKLTNLAENESIYSTRFIGDKLYMVTFRQMDPFFVIDLSNPTNPQVLGYLKIPGYSSYLHPIADNKIIGVGKETEDTEGRTTTKGIKISLFDVSDFSNPKEIDKYEIGLQGSESPILYDYKAFLYSSTKNLLVIPVSEIVDRIKSGDYNYRTKTWDGAYVFSLNDEGFTLEGKVKHASSETQYYYWFNDANVRRSIYIGDNLYTISTKYVKVNDLTNNLDELESIDLPSNTYANYPTPMMG